MNTWAKRTLVILGFIAMYFQLGTLWMHVMHTYVWNNHELTTWWQHALAGGFNLIWPNRIPDLLSSEDSFILSLWGPIFIIFVVFPDILYVLWIAIKFILLGGLMEWLIILPGSDIAYYFWWASAIVGIVLCIRFLLKIRVIQLLRP